MVYGVIDRHRKNYTYLKDIFEALENKQKEYNWLVKDCEIAACSEELEKLNKGYHFLSGDEMSALVEKDNSQWIWGMLAGFDKSIPFEDIMRHPLPTVENPGFWANDISLQHPLSSLEIVPFDSSFVLLLSTKKELVDLFRAAVPTCEDLTAYNR